MIEWNGYAHPVIFGIAKPLTNKVPIIQKIIVRKCNAFWKPCCAGSVLNIYRIIKLDAVFN